jgi:hypothetical protein
MPRSPKGKITNKSVRRSKWRWEQISPGGFQLRGPDVRHEIKGLIAFWRRFAGWHIEAKPATKGTLDRTAAAKAVLKRLQVIEGYLAAAERNSGSGGLYVAIYHGMLLANYVHQLTIIDTETAIVAWEESIKGGRLGGRNRSAKIRNRNREMALELLKRRGGRMSNTALMVEIGADEGLKRRAAIYAIKSGLKDLNRD